MARKTLREKDDTKDARKNRQTERKKFNRHVLGNCQVCLSPDRDEIEKAYRQWWKTADISHEFQVRPAHLTAHAEVFEWTKQRAENMDSLYVRLLDETRHAFDPAKITSQEALEGLIKLAFHKDRLQGRVINKHEVDAHKSITFVAVPLPGGAPPLIKGEEVKLLAPAPVIEAEWWDHEDQKEAEPVGRVSEESGVREGSKAQAADAPLEAGEASTPSEPKV